jgi:arylsulfatase A-like enzyme
MQGIQQIAVIISCALFLFSTALLPRQSYAAASGSKPNIIIILVDDMGWSDVGCYGGEIDTPNLDALASNGLRYTNFYNTGRCWPTRSSLLTGYYAPAIGMDPPNSISGGPDWVTTIPQQLQQAGYRSYHSGKWHYKNKKKVTEDGGFDKSYYLNENDNYFYDYNQLLNDVQLDFVSADTPRYSATTVTDYAVKFLADHQQESAEKPFFLYLAYTIPHFPLKAPAEDIAKYRDRYTEGWDALKQERWRKMKSMGLIDHAAPPRDPKVNKINLQRITIETLQDSIGAGEVYFPVAWESLTNNEQEFQSEKMAIHAAMVDRIDQETGRVVDQLKRMGVFDDTIIFFLSDNGASAEIMIRGKGHDHSAPNGTELSYLCLGAGWADASNTPFRRFKMWNHEGGIATPLIAHWPNGIQAKGEIRNDMGHVVDFMTTALDLAGVQPPTGFPDGTQPQLHGLSLAPTFNADNVLNREFLYFSHAGNRALRMGDWKIVSEKIEADKWHLYNLANDRGEQIDRQYDKPELYKTMIDKWNEVNDYYQELGRQ